MNNLQKNQKSNKNLIKCVLKSIYWLKFTANQQKVIANIIKDNEIDDMAKANLICEFLGIEKRGNRSAIVSVLNVKQ